LNATTSVRVTEDFGVVIPAKSEHLHWVRGACASVRHFMGETPICVLLDGERFPDDLRRTYDVQIIRGAEIGLQELCELSLGSLKAKNVALWASPFERFLLIDADAVVWGDMRAHADFDRFDFVLDEGNSGPDYVRRWIMDVEAVSRHIPDFDARGYAHRFVNTGAYFGTRGLLDLDSYLELLRFSQAHPGMFYGSQGVFNFTVFRAADAGALRVDQRRLQVTTGLTPREDLLRRFRLVDGRPHGVGEPAVLHWAGSPKPRVREGDGDYFAPMTFFRLEYRRAARHDGHTRRVSDLFRLRLEDALCSDWRGSNLRGRLGRLQRRLGQRWARWRVALRARVPDRIFHALRGPSRTR
jgi:hypothetical protein